MVDDWDLPLKGCRSVVVWQIQEAFRNSPGMSMFTEKALSAMAGIAAEAIPVIRPDDQNK